MQDNTTCNKISKEMYVNWRKDFFENGDHYMSMIIKFYSWEGEKILISDSVLLPKETYGRKFLVDKHKAKLNTKKYENIKIYVFMKNIFRFLKAKHGTRLINKSLKLINGNSTNDISKLLPGQISLVFTSPPYYNAREYSQWDNLIMYLIDMMLNSFSVFNTITSDGMYFYNVADIVNNDNIYVKSNMSKCRISLGALSSMIFEIVGFNLIGNIIWYKNEVQSKRNSTNNLYPGFIKPINSYEHILVFSKRRKKIILPKTSITINPVIKINSRGQNKYGHTAPFPIGLLDLIKPFVKKDKYVLDPFLGSGTTMLWCKQNNIKCIGYEKNKDYFKLAKERLK